MYIGTKEEHFAMPIFICISNQLKMRLLYEKNTIFMVFQLGYPLLWKKQYSKVFEDKVQNLKSNKKLPVSQLASFCKCVYSEKVAPKRTSLRELL